MIEPVHLMPCPEAFQLTEAQQIAPKSLILRDEQQPLPAVCVHGRRAEGAVPKLAQSGVRNDLQHLELMQELAKALQGISGSLDQMSGRVAIGVVRLFLDLDHAGLGDLQQPVLPVGILDGLNLSGAPIDALPERRGVDAARAALLIDILMFEQGRSIQLNVIRGHKLLGHELRSRQTDIRNIIRAARIHPEILHSNTSIPCHDG